MPAKTAPSRADVASDTFQMEAVTRIVTTLQAETRAKLWSWMQTQGILPTHTEDRGGDGACVIEYMRVDEARAVMVWLNQHGVRRVAQASEALPP